MVAHDIAPKVTMSSSRILRSVLATLVLSLATVISADAHVSLVYPTGGETFTAGSRVFIEWQEVIAHNGENWDLYWSPDGGSTWEPIQLDIAYSFRQFEWDVPTVSTTTGRIRVVQDNVSTDYQAVSGDIVVEVVGTAIDDGAGLPGARMLVHGYPNPFTGSTVFSVEVQEAGPVEVEIFDVTGNRVALLEVDSAVPGMHEIPWSAGELPTGIYLARVEQRGRVATTVVVLAR